MFAIPFVGPILAGLFSPLGRIVLIALAFATWTMYQRHDAAEDARSECQAVHLRRVIAEIERQRDVAKLALSEAEKQSEADEAELARMKGERDALLAGAKKNSCDIDPRDLDRVRNIR